MMNILAELKRRQMFRVAAAYAVVAWVLLQVVNNVAPALMLPSWAATLVLVLLSIGFPVALLFCWIQQLAPGRESSKATTGKLDWVLIGALVVVIGLLSYQQLAPNGAATVEQQAGVVAARSASLSPAGVSVAVLPFANVSADPEQEFFSDGITDEISGVLAKIPDLRVVGRTSAFQYKTRNADLRSIGQALNATHLIEGSVRRAGGRVRISVQLTLAESGLQLWTENYDRELTDVFAIQEDIARAIASSLNMQLGLRPGENIVNNRAIGADDYQQYLKGRALVDARQIPEAIAVLEGITARNANYAPAWVYLAAAYGLAPNRAEERNGSAEDFRRVVDAYAPKADAALTRAIQLDPSLPGAYQLIAARNRQLGKQLEADEYYSRAVTLDPAMAMTHGRALGFEVVGRVKEGLAVRQQLKTIEPFVPIYNRALVGALWINGRTDDAIAMAKTLPPDGRDVLSMIYASLGRYSEAADALKEASGGTAQMELAAERLLRTAPTRTTKPQDLPALGTRLAWAYLYVGGESRVLDNYETLLEGGRLPGQEMGWLWHPAYAPVRKSERFKAFVRKAGLVDYWRERGWPDLCKPVGANDFACE